MEHSSTVAKLESARRALEEKTARHKDAIRRLHEIEALPRASLSDDELETLLTLKDSVRAMEIEVDRARAECDEVEYYLKAGDILFKYYDIIDKGGTVAHQGAHDDGMNQDIALATTDALQQQQHQQHQLTTSTSMLPTNSIMRFFSGGGGVNGGSGGSGGVNGGSGGCSTSTFDNGPPSSSSASVALPESDGPSTQLPGGTTMSSPSNRSHAKSKRYGITSTTMNKSRQGTAADDRATLLEKYLTCTNTDFIKSDAPEDEAAIENAAASVPTPCAHCRSTNRTVMTHDGYIFCNECFTLEYVLVDHEKPSYKDPPKEVTYFAYKRINHFNEWLNQVQGKETTDIPDEVYDRILLEIKKQKISNMADLTNTKVREILKKLKINKYYEHIPHIINRLSGVSMPHIPPELEDRLRHMFCQIQVPFLKHSPPSRKNFLSYSYVLHKFMQLLEKDQYVHCFGLLKSRDKLQAQDIIWSKICQELGWEFVRSL